MKLQNFISRPERSNSILRKYCTLAFVKALGRFHKLHEKRIRQMKAIISCAVYNISLFTTCGAFFCKITLFHKLAFGFKHCFVMFTTVCKWMIYHSVSMWSILIPVYGKSLVMVTRSTASGKNLFRT